jgi:hypothetical protein
MPNLLHAFIFTHTRAPPSPIDHPGVNHRGAEKRPPHCREIRRRVNSLSQPYKAIRLEDGQSASKRANKRAKWRQIAPK